MSEWQPIETAKIGQRGMFWHPTWRAPFPGIVNGDGGSVYIDTPTPEHGGWQTHASHWHPIITPAMRPMPSAAEIDARFDLLRQSPNLAIRLRHGLPLPPA